MSYICASALLERIISPSTVPSENQRCQMLSFTIVDTTYHTCGSEVMLQSVISSSLHIEIGNLILEFLVKPIFHLSIACCNDFEQSGFQHFESRELDFFGWAKKPRDLPRDLPRDFTQGLTQGLSRGLSHGVVGPHSGNQNCGFQRVRIASVTSFVV